MSKASSLAQKYSKMGSLGVDPVVDALILWMGSLICALITGEVMVDSGNIGGGSSLEKLCH